MKTAGDFVEEHLAKSLSDFLGTETTTQVDESAKVVNVQLKDFPDVKICVKYIGDKNPADTLVEFFQFILERNSAYRFAYKLKDALQWLK